MMNFKKKHKLRLLGVALVCGLGLTFAGCAKSDDDDKDPVKPAEVVCAADQVKVDGVCTDTVTCDDGTIVTDASLCLSTTFNFEDDVLPLFTAADGFGGSVACTTCHSGTTAASQHELGLTTAEEVWAGADGATGDPVSILGQKAVGEPVEGTDTETDWSHSKMRERLRNNRMPPDISSTANRSTAAINEVGAWVTAGAGESYTVDMTFTDDVLPLFTSADGFGGTVACTTCHSGTTAASQHELGLNTVEEVWAGADGATGDPVSVLGQVAAGEPVAGTDTETDWGHSKMRERLRNNRMPPDISSTANRSTVAINLVGAWVTAGAPATAAFDCDRVAGTTSTDCTFAADVEPLMTTADAFGGSVACSTCHSGTTAASQHELGLTTAEEIWAGADGATGDPVSILGQVAIGEPVAGTDTETDWAHSKMRERLRNNRMPPDISSTASRDTMAINTVGAWVTAGAGETFTMTKTFTDDIAPLFATADAFGGTIACTTCHSGTTAASAHELGLSTVEEVWAGADGATGDPVSVLGQVAAGEPVTGTDTETDWAHSKMRERLRNNRMPPDISSAAPRDTPAINLVGAWIQAGAPATDSFECAACTE